jgi:hypothetical protein
MHTEFFVNYTTAHGFRGIFEDAPFGRAQFWLVFMATMVGIFVYTTVL